LQVTKSGDNNLLTLFRNENGTNTECGILFKDRNAVAGGQDVARIYSVRQSSLSSFDLAFETSDAAAAPARRLTIKADGKVGIGTTSPGSALEINAAVATSPFIAKINTIEAARIDSSGRLGLGTSSPENRLHIVGTSATTNTGATVLVDDSASLAADIGGSVAFRGVDDGGGIKTYGLIRGGKLNAGTGFDGYLALETRSNGQANTTERLRITHAGNVGIGVTVPSSLLHLADAGNITVGTTTGTKIGTATSQKIGFYNATPVVQPTTGIDEAAFVENSGGTAVNVDSTFGGYTIQQVVQALKTLGLLA
jgi:hypothetical protein